MRQNRLRVFFILAWTLTSCSDATIQTNFAPPVVAILSPSDDQQLYEGDAVTLTGTVVLEGIQQSEVTYSWNSNLDGTLASGVMPEGQESVPEVPPVELSGGEHRITLFASGNGQQGEDFVSVTVRENHAPNLEIIEPDPTEEYIVEILVALRVFVSDQETQPENLTVFWNSDVDGALGGPVTPQSDSYAVSSTMLSLGEHLLTATVTDPQGKTRSADVAVTVWLPNDPPTCSIEQPLDNSGMQAGDFLTVLAMADDPDGDPEALVALLTSNLNGQLGPVINPLPNGLITFANLFLQPGDHTLVLRVEDSRGGTCTDFIVLHVSTPPTVSIWSPADGSVLTYGSSSNFAAQVVDAEDPEPMLSVQWESNQNGLLSTVPANALGEVSFSTSNLSAGMHTITLTVTDTAGLSATSSITVNVNQRPTVTINQPSTGQVFQEGANIVFSATVSDPEDPATALSIQWVDTSTLTLLSALPPTSSGQTSFVATSLTAGMSHTVLLTVSDTDGAQETDLVTFEVNDPPTVTILLPQENEVFPQSSPVTFQALVTDTEDGPSGAFVLMQVSWVSSVDGQFNNMPPSITGDLAFTYAGLSNVAHLVVVTVTDTDNASAMDQVVFSLNAAPTIPIVEINPLSPSTADDLVAEIVAESVDPDGGSVSYSYEWDLDGVFQPTLLTDTVSASLTSHFEEWTVVLLATDDAGNTVASAPASVTIENTAPEGPPPEVSPSTGTETTVFTCQSFGNSDLDSDFVSEQYEWFVNGQPTGGSTPTLDGVFFEHFDELTCGIILSDGVGGTTVVTSEDTAAVLNSPPTGIPVMAVAPTGPGDNDWLTCTPVVSSVDVDGDPLMYTSIWTMDGTPTPFQDTIPPSVTSPGDTWACQAQALDGLGGVGPWSSWTSETIQCNWTAAPAASSFGCPGAGICNDNAVLMEDAVSTSLIQALWYSCALGNASVSACVTLDFGTIETNRLIRVVAQSTSTVQNCLETCDGLGCTPQSDYLVLVSDLSTPTYYQYVTSVTVPVGSFQSDTIDLTGYATRYVAICRPPQDMDHNNLLVDFVGLCD